MNRSTVRIRVPTLPSNRAATGRRESPRMSTTILVQIAIAAGLIGCFAASYLRFSRPARASDGRSRVAPKV
jgi:hypothetical protein